MWGEATTETPWHAPLAPAGEDEYGVFWEVELLDQGGTAEFLVHRGDDKVSLCLTAIIVSKSTVSTTKSTWQIRSGTDANDSEVCSSDIGCRCQTFALTWNDDRPIRGESGPNFQLGSPHRLVRASSTEPEVWKSVVSERFKPAESIPTAKLALRLK